MRRIAMVQIPTLFLFIRRRGVLATLVQPFTIAMNKTELARKIQALDGLDNEEKTALLELLRKQKKYGLVWEEKSEDIEERLRDELPILVERNDEKVHPIISDNPDAPNHLIIEGDNLAALTELSYTHAGKIDVIYIDPPYNTGNKDFTYNDSYVDIEDNFRHSKWLSFISKRLRLVKSLMSSYGVIFISIDDNEYANLKLLCDEIFDSQFCLGDIIRITTKRIKGDTRNINVIHDHILVYTNNSDFQLLHKLKDDYSIYELEDEHVKTRGKYLIRPLDNGSINYSNKSDYVIIAPDGSEIVAGGDKDARFRRISGHANRKDWCFRWSEEKLKWGLENDFIVFKKTKNGWRCYFKIYQFVDNKLQPTAKLDNQTSIIDECYNNQGTTEIKSILPGNNIFTYPKPISLIKTLITLCKSNITVLDFFAGSGTTLHAVMQLNAEDGGKRTCILCTNNENGICENVTYERNKRVIEGYTKQNGEYVAGLTDNNLRYYRTEFLPRERSVKNMRELVKASTGLLCIKNDLYTEAPFGGRKMNSKYARYFEHGEKRMLVIYDERTIPFIVDIVKSLPEGEKIKVYIFSYGSYSYEDEFAEVENQVELCVLPQAIYDAYQKVLPKRKPKFIVDDLVSEIEESESTEVQGTFDFDYEETEKGGDE